MWIGTSLTVAASVSVCARAHVSVDEIGACAAVEARTRITFIHVYTSTLCRRCTRGVQKVRRLTQLTTRYANHILSLFNIDACNWNALGPVFLQRSDTVVEELLFLVFQPVICSAVRTRMANTVGDGVVQSRHFGWQPVLELWSDALSWLQVTSVFFLNWKNSWKDTKFSDNEDVICTAYGWLEDQGQQFFYNRITALEKCWTKCISVTGV